MDLTDETEHPPDDTRNVEVGCIGTTSSFAVIVSRAAWQAEQLSTHGTMVQLVPVRDRERLMTLARWGPPGLACQPRLWRWRRAGAGWYVCEDGRTFEYDGKQSLPAPSLPPTCAESAVGTNVNDTGVGLFCQEDVFVLRRGQAGWSRVRAPEELRSVVVGDRCIFGNSRTGIWRLCVGPDAARPL